MLYSSLSVNRFYLLKVSSKALSVYMFTVNSAFRFTINFFRKCMLLFLVYKPENIAILMFSAVHIAFCINII